MTPDASIDRVTDIVLKLAVAFGTALLLLVRLWLGRIGRARSLARVRDGLLLALGLAGALAWWHFLGFPVQRFAHAHDGFHYFVGAKYFAELGYTRIYACTLAADLDAGVGAGLETRRIRNLESNVLELATAATSGAAECKARFAPERWRAFLADVAWFRGRMPSQEWKAIVMDHGFNGSPVWLLTGSLLASAVGGAEQGFVRAALVDPALLLVMWIGLCVAFGWRAACVAAVFWGTNGFSGFDWTGGSLLRQDWLVALALGIACSRRGAPMLAGALLTYSTLLRVFPGLVLAALVLKSGLAALRARSLRPSRAHARFAFGCLLALALGVPLATWQSGPDAWSGFAANSRKLLATPLLNQMGLQPAVLYESANRARVLEDPQAPDPHLRWKQAQREQLVARGWIIGVLGALYVALLLRALPKLDDWALLALATGAIPIATHLTCYYHAALLPLALLWVSREGVGVAMCLLAGVTQWIASSMAYSDVPFVRMSVAEVAAVFFVTWLAGNRSRTG